MKTMVTSVELIKIINSLALPLKHDSKNMTVGEYLSTLVKENILNESTMRELNKVAFLRCVESVYRYEINNREWVDKMDEILSSMYANKSKKTIKGRFKSIVFKTAIDRKWINKNFLASRRLYEKEEHRLGNRKSIKLEERTFEWYMNEICASKHQLSQKVGMLTAVMDLYTTKAKKEDLKYKGNKHERSVYFALLQYIYDKGGLSFNPLVLWSNEEEKRISFNDNVWVFKERGIRKKIDFSDVDSKKIRDALKRWIIWRIDKGNSDHTSRYRDVKRSFLRYIEEFGISLEGLSNIKMKKWILWLSDSDIKDSMKKNAVSSTKQFLQFICESGDIKVHKSFDVSLIPNPFRKAKHRNGYSGVEINQVISLLRKIDDKQFYRMMILLMLTARRKGEILSLKKDCLVDIVGIKYLKYTSHKTKKEMRVPLQSYNFSGGNNLFMQDVSSVIESLINEQMEYLDSLEGECRQEDEDCLFMHQRTRKNSMGFKKVRVSNAIFHAYMEEFIFCSGIKFRIQPHRFRHTLATAIIRGGKGVELASRVLGNTSKTVSNYYESDVTKTETLMLEQTPRIDAVNKAKELENLKNIPTVQKSSAVDNGCLSSVYGGWCSGGEEVKMSCKYYNRLFGSGGCLGCASLVVTKENIFYYEELKIGILNEMENVKGTPFVQSVENKLNLVEQTLEAIKKEGK